VSQIPHVDPRCWTASYNDSRSLDFMPVGKKARATSQKSKAKSPGDRQPRVALLEYVDQSAPAVIRKRTATAVQHGANTSIFARCCRDHAPFNDEVCNQVFAQAGNRAEIKSVDHPAGVVRQATTAVHTCPAFTLLELLVALAIIAVLAGLIFLGLSSAQERSAIAKSSSNLRQLGLLAQRYAAENNGLLPVRDFAPAAAAAFQWTSALYTMAYGKPFPGWVPAATAENLKDTIFHSPMMKSDEGPPLRSYGINRYLARKPLTNNTEPDNRLSLAAVGRASATLLFADARNGSDVSEGDPNTPRKIQFRNNGRALLCFVDGHVESRLPDEVPRSSADVFWSGK
jgi:prepilin-type N-terminal cleavage/methylation domain-containing protein/prepilin-type processing-associated H-X9-DG protein